MSIKTTSAFVDPKGLLGFLEREYLQSYIRSGGGKFKLIVGREGSGKTTFLSRLGEEARANGYMVADISARKTSLGKFDEVYKSILRDIDLSDIIKKIADTAIEKLGYDSSSIKSYSFVSWVEEQGRVREVIQRDIRHHLEDLYKDRNLTNSFAAATVSLSYFHLQGISVDDERITEIMSWLRGNNPINRRILGNIGIYRPIDSFSARHSLRSLLFLLRRVGRPGLLILLDDLDHLVSSSKNTEGVKYIRQRRDDTYESLRQFIDDTDVMPGLFFISAGRPIVMSDSQRGIPSYTALHNRLENEVDAEEFNCFSDVLDLDKAWDVDWKDHRKKLIENWTKALGQSGVLAANVNPAAFETPGLLSPVIRLVRALERGDE